MKSLICLLLFLIHIESFGSSGKVRRVAARTDQIEVVRTALGIATIIQVPYRPNSLVIGDTESFKVEYLDQAITIKPLRPGARSNLYIFTEYQRFNVQLVTQAETEADYVVYLDPPNERATTLKVGPRWTHFRNRLKNESLSLEIERLGRTQDGLLVLELRISGIRHEVIDPKWIWVTQGGQTWKRRSQSIPKAPEYR